MTSTIVVATDHVQAMLNHSAQALQQLTRDRIDYMSKNAAAARQRMIAPILEQLAVTYITLAEARVSLSDPWSHERTLSLLVHDTQMLLRYPTGDYHWDGETKDHWSNEVWQNLLSIHSEAPLKSMAPTSVLVFST